MLLLFSLSLFIFALFELITFRIFYKLDDRFAIRGDNLYEMTKMDKNLGYSLVKNKSVIEKRYYPNDFDKTSIVTTNKHGLRITPESELATDSILFFGCSFTYGEGLSDDETLPYLLGEIADGGYQTYNFGVYGYGPQHMLYFIQNNYINKIVNEDVKYVFYSLIYPEHIFRASGERSWLKTSPKFMIEDNELVYKGNFIKMSNSKIINKIYNQLLKSYNYKVFLMIKNYYQEDKYKIFVSILLNSKELLLKDYPNLKFYILVWGENLDPFIEKEFINEDIIVLRIEDILPNYIEKKNIYEIDETDAHPNRLANIKISKYLLKNIIYTQ